MFGEDPAVAAAAHSPSGDALDRATELVSQYQSIAHGNLIEEIAKLIDRADAATADDTPSGDALDRAIKTIQRAVGRGDSLPVGTHVRLAEEIARLIDRADAAPDKERIGGHGVVHWRNIADRRVGQINELGDVVRRRNARIAELESELEDKRRSPSFAHTIDELERMVMERNGRITELEGELEALRRSGGANLRRAIDRATEVESELRIAERNLEIADRQRREFLGHSRTANARRAEAERERDDARRMTEERELELRELRARTDHAIEGALGIATTDQLVDEVRRRLNT